MSDQQVFELIWEPGFSTAEKITEISGRGVGMDIVREKIVGLGGTVEIDSTPGRRNVVHHPAAAGQPGVTIRPNRKIAEIL